MMQTRRTFLTFLSLAPLLGACVTTAQRSAAFVEIGFDHLAPIGFKVGQISLTDAHVPGLKAPNVEHRFPTSPSRAAIKWADRRLMAVGEVGDGEFRVIEASVIESTGEAEDTTRYDAVLEADLVIREPGASGHVSARAVRSLVVGDAISLAEREQRWLEMTEALMRDFDQAFVKEIHTHLGDWLVTP